MSAELFEPRAKPVGRAMQGPHCVRPRGQTTAPHPQWTFSPPEIHLDEALSGLLELSQHLHAHRYFGGTSGKPRREGCDASQSLSLHCRPAGLDLTVPSSGAAGLGFSWDDRLHGARDLIQTLLLTCSLPHVFIFGRNFLFPISDNEAVMEFL